MLLMVVSGTISLIFGVIFLMAPWLLRYAKRSGARGWIDADTLLLNHRIATGLCLLAVGLFCFASVYYVWLRLHS